jgi:hypothetical protein
LRDGLGARLFGRRPCDRPGCAVSTNPSVSFAHRFPSDRRRGRRAGEEHWVGCPPRLLRGRDLRLWPNNPNVGDLDAIARSLRFHGQVRPIIASRGTPDLEDGTIVVGNHTFRAATEKLGWQKVAVLWHAFPSEDDAARYLIADNHIAQLAEPDWQRLASILEDLLPSRGVEGTGLTHDQAQAALHKARAEREAAGPSKPDKSRGHRAEARGDQPTPAEPPVPEVEMLLLYTVEQRDELVRHIDALRRYWGMERARDIVFRALSELADRELRDKK